jgi:hypothetical protein
VPARNSAKATPATLGHGFECPVGDGGHCALPSPPIVVQHGEMRQAADSAEELRGRPVQGQWLQMMKATGVDGMRELVEVSARDQPGVEPAVVLPCSCGHVFTARNRA